MRKDKVLKRVSLGYSLSIFSFVTPPLGNRHSPTVIVAAITSRIKHRHQPTHVHLDGRQCGLPNDSTIMLEQLRTLDKQRLLGYIGSIGKAKMKEVDQALEISVGTSKKPLPP